MVNLKVGSRQSPAQIAVLHIPHSSKFVPVEGRQAVRLDNAALDNELLRMTDSFTDELFPVTQVEAGRVIIPVSRLVCDVERFPLDEQEPMVARGMGVILYRDIDGGCAQSDAARVQQRGLNKNGFIEVAVTCDKRTDGRSVA